MDSTGSTDGPRPGTRVVHRRYVPYSHAHYAGNLVDGAYSLGLFGDVATEMCIVTDGDEGLFAGYERVEFLAPLHAGDFVRARGTIARMGNSSRTVDLELWKEITTRPDLSDSAADYLDEPQLVTRARGTYVVQKQHSRGPQGRAV